jgi:hypothetical protein
MWIPEQANIYHTNTGGVKELIVADIFILHMTMATPKIISKKITPGDGQLNKRSPNRQNLFLESYLKRV